MWDETGITDHDGEGVSADGWLHRHSHPLIFGEHELANRQQTRLRGLIVQAHPGHLTWCGKEKSKIYVVLIDVYGTYRITRVLRE